MNQHDTRWMQHAVGLATRGEGLVEPNPMVGCVIVKDGETIGEGYHAQFGGPHAEVAALEAAGEAARGATMYVTLEPCCHEGKTPPCTRAVIDAGIARIVIAMRDPFAKVDGGGIAELERAGVAVEVCVLDVEARRLNAPYIKRVTTGRPWIIAKWAMTLDGKIATRTGESKWISNETAREVVHALRGRVDAIIVGSRTAALDDPQLTARPPGPRVATRIVVDSAATLSLQSRLVETASELPVLVVCGPDASAEKCTELETAGCEVLTLDGVTHAERLDQLLDELGGRSMTNVLAEGGGGLLGSLWDAGQIDEVYAFVAPKLVGGAAATPLAGLGHAQMPTDASLVGCETRILGGDVFFRGHVRRNQVNIDS